MPGLSDRIHVDPRKTPGIPRSACQLAIATAAFLYPLGVGFNPARSADSPPPKTDKDHWAFKKPVRPVLPHLNNAQWVATPVDSFVLARMESAGVAPAAPADRTTLLRRVTFDLTGLPPTPDEIERFLNDTSPDAYSLAVERLLASPHHGERWAQHWLDVVRFADSNGFEVDGDRPHAWRYRDYVVRSLNDNKPFDRFVTEQLAGDLLARGMTPRECADLLLATGFFRCGPVHLVAGNIDKDEARHEVLTEMTDSIGSTFLGLTVACARCHDHKFDPFSQGDYYRLQAFLAGTMPKEIDLATAADKEKFAKRKKELDLRLEPLRQQVRAIEAPYRQRLTDAKKKKLEPGFRDAVDAAPDKRTPEQKKLADQAMILLMVSWDEILEALSAKDRATRDELRSQIRALETELPEPLEEAWAVAEEKEPPPTHVLKRGNLQQKKERVEPAFPQVFLATMQDNAAPAGKNASPTVENPTRLDRREMARWLTASEHPLTARVMVNRLWRHHFGRGLVATPNDFGKRGAPPTHPELLDWLACEFVESGWSLKHLHRLMVLSNTYRQASRLPSDARARRIDPDNLLLARMNRQRRDGESLRDTVLAVSGRLNLQIGGPPVRVPLEPEVYDLIFTEAEPDGLWPVTPDQRAHTRRSLYLMAKRNVRMPLFEAFDQPDRLTSCPARSTSTYAPQALILFNGPFLQEESKQLAARLFRECGSDSGRQVERAYGLALGRPPTAFEGTTAREFLESQTELLRDRLRARLRIPLVRDVPEETDPAAAAALVDFCLALFNQNEFLYVD
jgi:hypothetical protein